MGTSQIPRMGQPDLSKFFRLNLLGVLKEFLDKKRKKKSELPFQNFNFRAQKGCQLKAFDSMILKMSFD